MERQRYWLDERSSAGGGTSNRAAERGQKPEHGTDWFYTLRGKRTVLQEGSDKPDEDGSMTG